MRTNAEKPYGSLRLAITKFHPERIATAGRVFPDNIETDLWTMFHGTSEFNAKYIERDGFGFQPAVVTRDQIRRVTDLYATMKWSGEQGGGYPVLKPFSLDYDLRKDSGLIFFAETSARALLYSTRNFAGGEKLRSLRIALRDLHAYLNDPNVRARHKDYMTKAYQRLVHLNAHPSELEKIKPVEVELDWLKEKLAEVEEIRAVAEGAYSRHASGVVYALKMAPSDIVSFHWHDSMGIESSEPVQATHIVSKVVVPIDYEINLFSMPATEESMYRRTARDGLVAAIAVATH